MVKVRAVVVPVALIGMLAVPGLLLGRIYSGDLMPRLLLVVALVSVTLSELVRRLPAWTAAPASVLGLAGFTLLAVRLSARSGEISGALPDLTTDALRNGIPRLLTAMIPIEPQPDTVLIPVITTWLAGLAAAELALRYQRVLLSYAMPTLLLGGALYLVGPNARPTLLLPLTYAAFAALGLAGSVREPGEPALTRDQRTTLRVRLAGGAVAVLAMIIALATAVGPSVAGRVDNTPTDPRRYVTPPQLDSLDENPLVRLSGWALNPDQRLFDAKVTGADHTRIRLAVLSDYDGVNWRVGATYRNAGRVLTGPPSEAQKTGPAKEIGQQIKIDELDGRLLPGAATPERIDGVRIAYDESTGTMALPDGLQPGVTYTVVSRQPALEVNLLPGADVPTGDAAARYVALPGKVPADITSLAQQLGSSASSPYQRALAIEQFLAEHYSLVSDAPSGHAYPNLSYFLFGPPVAGGQRGTSEQFAAAYAVLARALGLPARVAVGFQAKAGTNTVRGADAIAWPEILFTGIGWVDFNPLPQPNTKPRPVEEDFRPRPDPSTPPPAVVPTPSASAAPHATPSGQAGAPGRGGVPSAVVALRVAAGLAGAGLLGLIAYAVAIPVLRRRLRRSRLGGPEPGERITGAWLELLDGLRMAGRPALAHLAATEVVRYAATAAGARAHSRDSRNAVKRFLRGLRLRDRENRPGLRPSAPPIDDLATLANAVAFGAKASSTNTTAPSTASEPALQIDDGAAHHAAAQAVAYVGELRARRPWWRRLLWTVDPRPLWWDRLRRRTARG
jgi:transglutaminase-like putative cysteine protease